MTTYYVDNSSSRANDGNTGLTSRNPFLTLARANTLAVANDTVMVMGGKYREKVTVSNDGQQWIAGNKVIIDNGSALSGTWTLHAGTVWKMTLASAPQSLYINGIFYALPALTLGAIQSTPEPHTLLVEGGFFYDIPTTTLYIDLGGLDPNAQLVEFGSVATPFELLSRQDCLVEGFTLHRSAGNGVRISGGNNNVIRLCQASMMPAPGFRIEGPQPALFRPTSGGAGGTLAAGTYYYRVTAIVDGIETSTSAVQSYTAAAGEKVNLSWSAVVGSNTYRIYGRSADVGPPLVATGTYMTTVVSSASFPVFIDDGTFNPDGVTQPAFTTTIKGYNHLIELCEAWQSGSHGFSIFNSSNNTLRRNESHHNSTHGFAAQKDASDNIIEENRSWSNWKVGARTSNGIMCDGFGIGTPGSPRNILQRNYCFRNQDSGISIYNSSDWCIVRYNVIYLNEDHGVDNYSSPNCHMINNTSVLNVTAGFNSEGGGIGGGIPSLGIRMYNNISVDNGIGSPRTTGNYRIDEQTVADSELDYNLSYLTVPVALQTAPGANGEFDYGPVTFSTLDQLRAANPGVMIHGQSVDPQFVNAAMNEYRVLNTSPARGGGTARAPDYQPYDFYGHLPSLGLAPSCGAYHHEDIQPDAT